VRHGILVLNDKLDLRLKVLIVCQAGFGIGLGHLSRSLVIANTLSARFKADVHFLIQGSSINRDDLKMYSHQFVTSNQELEWKISEQGSANIVFIDLHPQRVPLELGRTINLMHKAGAKVVAIDGLMKFRSELDLIFIPSFHFNLPADLIKGAPVVFGWDCFLLDPLKSRSNWSHGLRVLALSGGSDATDLGENWPSLLNQSLPVGSELHWVTGPFAQKPHLPSSNRINIVEHTAPAGLRPLMQQANYAVTVFGVSFFELLYLGVPTVVFSPYAAKDTEIIKAIEKLGIALVAENERDATDRLKKLMTNHELSLQLSTQAQKQLCVSGVERLCIEITRLMDCS